MDSLQTVHLSSLYWSLPLAFPLPACLSPSPLASSLTCLPLCLPLHSPSPLFKAHRPLTSP